MNSLAIISGFVLICSFYCSDAVVYAPGYGPSSGRNSYVESSYVQPSHVQPRYVLARNTQLHNLETYDKCQSSGKLNVVRIGRDEMFFQNMSCFNYYTTTPLARETFGLTLGDRPAVLSPIVNFTISNVVKGGYHYEIHEGFVADGDLINATVSKVKVFDESDFQKGCAQEPGLKFIALLRAEIVIKAPFGDYEITCIAAQEPGMNQYVPGIVNPEVLESQLKYK